MIVHDKMNGCCSSTSCCKPQKKKKLTIDFLYLDLNVCKRCQGTEKNLEEALAEVSGVLEAAGFELSINKVKIENRDLAIKYRFVSSPTIRLNGRDLELRVEESPCQDCGDLCGKDVNCRVWVVDGVQYSEPPKALIINAILREIYGEPKTKPIKREVYKLSRNLQVFFEGLENSEE
jgi:hypothetical protein